MALYNPKNLLDFRPSRPNYLPINKPKTDSPFIEFIITNRGYHSHNTRQANDPHAIAYHYKIVSDNFLYQAPEFWSKLPLETKKCFH